MLSVTAVLPGRATTRRPLVLVHGAANSALVWTLWQRELAQAGWASYAIDLRGHGKSAEIDLSSTTMQHYAEDVATLVQQLTPSPIVIGWSMGGLVAMVATVEGAAAACVGLAPSAPTRTRDKSVSLRTGEFGPEEYGIASRDPGDQPAMPDLNRDERAIALESLNRESRYARDERKAGIVIEKMPCPLLIVTGTEDVLWGRERYESLLVEAGFISIQGASHWGLVLSHSAVAATVPQVLGWLEENVS